MPIKFLALFAVAFAPCLGCNVNESANSSSVHDERKTLLKDQNPIQVLFGLTDQISEKTVATTQWNQDVPRAKHLQPVAIKLQHKMNQKIKYFSFS